MISKTSSLAARALRAVFISAGMAAAVSVSATTTVTAPAMPGAQMPVAAKSQVNTKPLWVDLNPAQQQALAPLSGEWDTMDGFRKKKWLAIGNKFASMKPDEQQRVQERMRDWVKLTPEQRRIARESYTRAKRLGPDTKSAEWERYQQLSDEQKKKLADAAITRKKVTTLPSPTAQATSSKTLPPIKSAHRPVLEQSVTPQGATPSTVPSTTQPSK